MVYMVLYFYVRKKNSYQTRFFRPLCTKASVRDLPHAEAKHRPIDYWPTYMPAFLLAQRENWQRYWRVVRSRQQPPFPARTHSPVSHRGARGGAARRVAFCNFDIWQMGEKDASPISNLVRKSVHGDLTSPSHRRCKSVDTKRKLNVKTLVETR